MIRTLQNILKIFIMAFTLPMFTTRCYPCCPLISLWFPPAVLRQPLPFWLWGLETQRSHCGEQHAATSKSHLEMEQLKASSISQICVWWVGLKISLHSLWEAHYSFYLLSVLTRHRAARLQRIPDPGWACPRPHEENKRPLKDEGRPLCVMAWWFSANSCPGSSLRRINTCNKAHHAPITTAICIGRLMLDEGEMCVPEGKGTLK